MHTPVLLQRIGEAVTQRRRADRMSQTELAQELSVSVRTLARLESGELDPRLGLLLDMERLFPGLLASMLARVGPGPRRGRTRPGLAKVRRKR